MSRPLLVTDCDEVLLHMVVPFAEWVDEAHHIHFDLTNADFSTALRHKATGLAVEREDIWPLLAQFFAEEMHRQYPIRGAVAAIAEIGRVADIVVLTNVGDEAREGRVAQLHGAGIAAPVVCNRGGKGEPFAAIVAEYAPSVTVFIDDLPVHHDSVARHVPEAWRLHMIGEPILAARIPAAPAAHARIDDWAEAKDWILTRFAEAPLEAA